MVGHSAWGSRVAGAVLVVLGAGCSGQADTGTIDDVRELGRPAPGLAGAATSAQRFGFGSGAHGPGDGHDHGDDPSAGAQEPGFTWALPEGWQELPTSSMRNANFQVAGDPNAECYLTLLPGGAGGVEANVNRWRGQLGLDPLSGDDIDALPRRKLVGGDAVYIDMRGDYRGMGSEAQPDYRMAGLILELPGATLFLKMVGPAAVLDGEMERFDALAASFAVSAPAAPRAASSSPNSAQGLAWETPPGWTRAGERSMRLVTFTPEGAPEAECYVAALPGDAGGVHANVNRWRSQMGQPELSAAELDGLERRTVLDSEAVFIEIRGDFTGMSGGTTSDAGFLGLICTVGGSTLFVKMTGPAPVIEAEREHFLSFCESLTIEGGS